MGLESIGSASKPAVPTKISHLPLPVLLVGLRGIFFFYTETETWACFRWSLLYLTGRSGRLCLGRAAGSRALAWKTRQVGDVSPGDRSAERCCNLPA